MAHGLLVKNNAGEILIDSDFKHYHFLGKYTHSSVTQVPDLLSGGVASGAQGSNANKGMENMPAKGEIYKYQVAVNGSTPPICFVKPTSTGISAPYAGIVLTKQVSNYWEIWVFQSAVTSASPVLYCFSPLSQISNSTSSTHGLKTFDNSGAVTFDSRFKPLRIVGGGNITAPALAHSGSSGSGFTVSLNVNATNVSAGFSTTSGSANDLIYYCPSLAHACQQYTYIEADEGWHSYTYYAWARGDLWWCFYRSCFRIGNYYQTNYNLEANYGVYARGHVYEHEVNSTNLLLGLVLGAITGGAYFVAAIAALGSAGVFTNASVEGGNYLPYENGSRNRSSNAFIISKASYYD